MPVQRESNKIEAAKHVRSKVIVGLHCHDCACASTEFDGVHCQRSMRDAWHAKKHKCCKKRFDPKHKDNKRRSKGCNTQAAEKLWSRMDKLAAFCSRYNRSHFGVIASGVIAF